MSIRFKHLAAAMALLLFCQPVAAQTCNCAPCPDECGEWAIGAHALYFTPITCPYAYATVSTTVVAGGVTDRDGQAQLIPCRAEWGFRVFGNHLNDCLFVGLSYQWFEVTTTRSIVAVAPEQVRIHGGSILSSGKATGQTGIEYQNADVRVGRYLLQRCSSALYLYGNVRWVDLSYRRAIRAFFPTINAHEDIREKSQLEGGAVGIGLGGEFDIWCNVGTFIDGNFLGIIGKRSIKDVRYRRFQVATLSERTESYPSETCVIPELNCRIGLNYTYACDCWKLVGEVGYEVDYFWHGSAFPDLVSLNLLNNQARTFQPVCEDLGFSGLFFGGRLIF